MKLSSFARLGITSGKKWMLTTNETELDMVPGNEISMPLPSPSPPNYDNSINSCGETTISIDTISSLTELSQNVLDQTKTVNVTHTDDTAYNELKQPDKRHTDDPVPETPEEEKNTPQNTFAPSLADINTTPVTDGDKNPDLPGKTPARLKPKPSTYYTVVNSTLDDIVFISKREIMEKKWKVSLPNLTSDDIKLLQLNTNVKRQIKPVLTHNVSLDSVDDTPAKPNRKPRPKLRPSSERIAAQALVNLQRKGVCTKPILKHSLPGIPTTNQQLSTDKNNANSDKTGLPGETLNHDDSANSILPTNTSTPRSSRNKTWSDLDTDDAYDIYDGDTEDYNVPSDYIEKSEPERKSRPKRKRQSTPQTRGNFSVQLHAGTARRKNTGNKSVPDVTL